MIALIVCLQDLTKGEYLESLRHLRETTVDLSVADLEPRIAMGLLESTIGVRIGAPDDLDFRVTFDAQDEPAWDLLRRVFAEHGLYLQCSGDGAWNLRRSPARFGSDHVERRGGEWIPLAGDPLDQARTFLHDWIADYIQRGREAHLDRIGDSFTDFGGGNEVSREDFERLFEEEEFPDLTGLAVEEVVNLDASGFIDAAGLSAMFERVGIAFQEGDIVIVPAVVVRRLDGAMVLDDAPFWLRRVDGEWRIIGGD